MVDCLLTNSDAPECSELELILIQFRLSEYTTL